MKTKAAVIFNPGEDWQIEEIELDDPVHHEVQVRLAASGLCHSDEHLRTGDNQAPMPIIGGHEGAGVVTKVGPGVTDLKEGDHVVLGFIPSCGKCKYCTTGHGNICDLGMFLLQGEQIADGTHRHHVKGQNAGTMCQLGTFSPYVTVHEASAIKIDDDLPLDKAALVGCGVTTGWGSSVYSAEVRAGDTVVIVGIGGVGINAVQGAKMAGASRIFAIDPVEFKREQAMAFGATHTYSSVEEALEPIYGMTNGQGADKGVITVGEMKGDLVDPTMNLIRKGGRLVITGIGKDTDDDVKLNMFVFTLFQKELRGSIFGGGTPRADIPKLLGLYRDGLLKLDELVTKTYKLEDINQGYADMKDGKNLRGMILYSDADY